MHGVLPDGLVSYDSFAHTQGMLVGGGLEVHHVVDDRFVPHIARRDREGAEEHRGPLECRCGIR